MRATVVPGRNLLLSAIAIATLDPGDVLLVGVHAGDHPIYPDCRPQFWAGLDMCAAAYGVRLNTPFLHLTKAEALEAGHLRHAPVEETWSCYQGGEQHCGRCGTCVERAEAFHLAGIPDPTPYADPTFWRKAVRSGSGRRGNSNPSGLPPMLGRAHPSGERLNVHRLDFP
jgi:7-cyano-7-deazaguanine synthase